MVIGQLVTQLISQNPILLLAKLNVGIIKIGVICRSLMERLFKIRLYINLTCVGGERNLGDVENVHTCTVVSFNIMIVLRPLRIVSIETAGVNSKMCQL